LETDVLIDDDFGELSWPVDASLESGERETNMAEEQDLLKEFDHFLQFGQESARRYVSVTSFPFSKTQVQKPTSLFSLPLMTISI